MDELDARAMRLLAVVVSGHVPHETVVNLEALGARRLEVLGRRYGDWPGGES